MRTRNASVLAALMLAILLEAALAPDQASAVICNNGGVGGDPAGIDGG